MKAGFISLYFLLACAYQSVCQTNNFYNYFRNPLNIPMELSANFGELRPNHWHMGLDIRTNQKENEPVYAAAEGYISKVSIQPSGFGRSIYINHSNGLTTLYAHLNDFFPELEEYVKNQQYKLESWEVELKIPENMFAVEKGSFIAYSGNTGASRGPHLHFEIRDTKTDKCLNPLLFDFPVEDDMPPRMFKLAMYERMISVYEQSPRLFSLKKTDTGYIIPKAAVLLTGSDKISFAIQAYDQLAGSKNPNGIYSATLFFDQKPIIEFVIDSIDYDETKYMNAHIDYRYRRNGGSFLQHLSKLPGDTGAIYNLMNGDGVIILIDTNVHDVRIEVKDEHMNLSELNCKIQRSDSLMTFAGISSAPIVLYPDHINVFERGEFEMFVSEGSVYDSVHAFYYRENQPSSGSISANHRIADPSIPIHNEFTVRIKPTTRVAEDLRNKIVIRRNKGGRGNVHKADWQGKWIASRFDEFGSFQGFIDNMPPQINNLGKKDTLDLSPLSRIVFQPKDNFGISNLRVELDGKWLRFTNDKHWSYIYNFDEKCPYGIHELKVTVEDLVGNTTTKTWWFKKYPYTPPKKVIKKKSKGKKESGGKKKKRKKLKG